MSDCDRFVTRVCSYFLLVNEYYSHDHHYSERAHGKEWKYLYTTYTTYDQFHVLYHPLLLCFFFTILFKITNAVIKTAKIIWQRWDSNPRLRRDWCLKPAP